MVSRIFSSFWPEKFKNMLESDGKNSSANVGQRGEGKKWPYSSCIFKIVPRIRKTTAAGVLHNTYTDESNLFGSSGLLVQDDAAPRNERNTNKGDSSPSAFCLWGCQRVGICEIKDWTAGKISQEQEWPQTFFCLLKKNLFYIMTLAFPPTTSAITHTYINPKLLCSFTYI